MTYTLKNCTIYTNKLFVRGNIIVEDGKICSIGEEERGIIYDLNGKLVAPSFIDPHIHTREPGFTHKGSIKGESIAAAHGGYTKCYMMPNVNPAPSNKEVLEMINDIVKKESVIDMHQIASITYDQTGKGHTLSDMEEIGDLCVGYSDDGNGVVESTTMYNAMLNCKKLSKPLISHCEDKPMVMGGVVVTGEYGKLNNLPMIDPVSEAIEVTRNCLLAYKTGCHLHICHLSSIDSVDIIRFYQRKGAHITCEVTPHQLTLTDMDIKDANFKMNPPLSTNETSEKLLAALKEGVISCIATDHAPHADNEKALGLLKAPFGIIGLETCFGVLYTDLVLTDKLELSFVLDSLSENVSKAFGLKSHKIKVGNDANLVVIDLDSEYKVTREFLLSKSKNTPYLDKTLKGEIVMTIKGGEIVYGK